MLNIEAEFDENFLESAINEHLEANYAVIAKRMIAKGEELIDRAIEGLKGPKYIDKFGNITHNLRSSMGVGVVIDGKLHSSSFPYADAKPEGRAKGIAYLAELAAKVPASDKATLIMVAGEHYSVYVEMKNFDVLTNASELYAVEINLK